MPPPLIPLAFNAWATRELLLECGALTDPQLDGPLAIGCGSVRRTFLHMVSADMFWSDRLLARDVRPLPEDVQHDASLALLLTVHDATSAELLGAVQARMDEGRLDEPIALRLPQYAGRTVAASTVLAQVVSHGAHHRAQVLNMLRQLGHPSGRDFDPVEWELSHQG